MYHPWHDYLGNETIAGAMVDRLIHNVHKVELKGPSMREILAGGIIYLATYVTMTQ